MEAMLEFLVVLPSAVVVVIGAVRGFWGSPWDGQAAGRTQMAAPAQAARRRLVLVHDNAREKLLRSPGLRPSRAAGPGIRLVYNGG